MKQFLRYFDFSRQLYQRKMRKTVFLYQVGYESNPDPVNINPDLKLL